MKKSVLSIEEMQALIDRGVDVSGASWLRVRDKLTGNVFLAENKSFEVLYGRVVLFKHFDLSDILEILPNVCNGVTLNIEFFADGICHISYKGFCGFRSENTLESAYQMLLWRIENNHIKTKKL